MSTTTADAPQSASSVTIEDLGPCRKRLTIEVPAARIAATLKESVQEVSATAALPGFRPGKAPAKLIERRFGQAIRDEAKRKLVSEAYSSAIEDHGLRVLGEPEGGDELAEATVEADTPLSFTIEVEIAPEFDLPSLAGAEILRPQIEITDEMVGEQIDKLATNEGRLEPKEAAEAGDYLVGRGVMKRTSDGKEIHNIEGAVIQIPTEGDRGMILGVMVEDFAKQVGTPKSGDSVTVKTTGPDQHEIEDVRGESLEITFTVEEINAVIPATMDELVERLGAPSEEELRGAIRRQMEHQVEGEQRGAMRRQIANKLLESVDFDLPERLSATQARRNIERRRMDLMHQGVDPTEIEEHMAELRAASDEDARHDLKLFFLIDRVAAENDVQITEQEVNGFIFQVARSRGMRPEAVRNELIQSGRIQNVAMQIREHKALDSLIEQASVKDVSVEEFNKAMGGGEDKAPAKKKTSKKKTTKKTSSKKSD